MTIYIEGEMGEPPITPMNFAAAMVNQELFKKAELEELAEYLLVYCKHNEDKYNFRSAFGTIDEMHEVKVDVPELFIRRCYSNSDIQED